MALNRLQEHRDIKITQCIHEVSHFNLNYFLHVAFRAIFETAKNGYNYYTIANRIKSRIKRIQGLGCLLAADLRRDFSPLNKQTRLSRR